MSPLPTMYNRSRNSHLGRLKLPPAFGSSPSRCQSLSHSGDLASFPALYLPNHHTDGMYYSSMYFTYSVLLSPHSLIIRRSDWDPTFVSISGAITTIIATTTNHP